MALTSAHSTRTWTETQVGLDILEVRWIPRQDKHPIYTSAVEAIASSTIPLTMSSFQAFCGFNDLDGCNVSHHVGSHPCFSAIKTFLYTSLYTCIKSVICEYEYLLTMTNRQI
jgi:hypothetical protein